MRLISAACVLGMLLAMPLSAAPARDPWPLWQVSRDTQKVIDHQLWNAFLERYLVVSDEGNRLAYGRVRAADHDRLQRYLDALQNIDPRGYNRAEQLAYWINLYNARTVALVLEHYPVDSIRAIRFGFFSFGPWDEPLVKVAGVPLSLNDIEHRILRGLWREPRIHYLLNCASLGCPDLWPVALAGEEIETQLEAAARRFINQRKGVDPAKARYSSIYVWFAEDFGGKEGVRRHLGQYAAPELDLWLQTGFADLDDHYDWALNGWP